MHSGPYCQWSGWLLIEAYIICEFSLLCKQAAEVEQRLKSLQGDYSALQNAHDRLESDGAARETELKSQIARLVEGEKKEEKGRMESEKTVAELQKRVTELEEALREAETRLHEKNKVNNFIVYYSCYIAVLKDESVQVLPVPAASPEANHNSSVPHHKPKPNLKLEDITLTALTATQPVTARRSPAPIPIRYPATDGAEVAQATTGNHCDSIHLDNTDPCKTSAATNVVPSPPKSSFLSPEVISDSSSTSPPEDKHTATDGRVSTHVEVK